LLNTPAHNPTGYSLTENEFDEVISFLNQCGKQNKRITFVIDPAYMDYVMDN
jgi:aromatic-amino-acid transaminase